MNSICAFCGSSSGRNPFEAPAALPGTVADPGNLIKETIERKPILIFGQRAGLFPRRKREGAAAPEQGSLFTFS